MKRYPRRTPLKPGSLCAVPKGTVYSTKDPTDPKNFNTVRYGVAYTEYIVVVLEDTGARAMVLADNGKIMHLYVTEKSFDSLSTMLYPIEI